VSGYCQRAESSQVSAVVQRYQTEWDDDQQDRFLVHVPAEEERGVGAECRGRYEVGPCRAEEELDESGLERKWVSLRL
jgi:hypothetical protein